MTGKVYKYFSKDVLDLVFAKDGYCGLKCSFPKDYNDPFELFLGVDLTVPTELLATYREVVNEVPQYPTTCFSKSPVSAPMWAHYAHNHSGFVLEFDLDCLRESFDEASLRDVEYKDDPNPELGYFVARSAATMKPRHAVWLQQAVFKESYYSKQTAWSYEKECRLVASEDHVESIHGNMVLFVPIGCVTSIIIGSRTTVDVKVASRQLAEKNQLKWYEALVGKSNSLPFLLDGEKETFVFDGAGIVPAGNVCVGCSEPISEEVELCAWCRITETDERVAAMSNPFRMLARAGILDEYFDSVDKIERSRKK